MKKIDAAALRSLLNEQMDKLAVVAADDPAARRTADIMARGRTAYIELLVFGFTEMERNRTEPFDGIASIGALLANACIHFTSMIDDVSSRSGDGMTAQHALIHVLLDAIDHDLHVLYKNREPSTANPEQVVTGDVFEIPQKEVGDA